MIPVKILCHCGTKYSIEIHENAELPDGSILCPNCQVDGTPAARLAVDAQKPTAPVLAAAAPKLSISKPTAPAPEPAGAEGAATPPPPPPKRPTRPGSAGRKRRSQQIRQEAEKSQGKWRLVTMSLAAVLVFGIGFWGVYKFYLIKPKVVFSREFDRKERPVVAKLLNEQELLIVNNRTVSRLNFKDGKTVWSHSSETTVGREEDELPDWYEIEDHAFRLPVLVTTGTSCWISWSDKLVCLDIDSGNVKKELDLPSYYYELGVQGGNVILLKRGEDGATTLEQLDESGTAKELSSTARELTGGIGFAVDNGTVVRQSVRMIEEHLVPVSAPVVVQETRKKVAVDENLTASQSLGATLTMLDETGLGNGDGEALENRSLYGVTLSRTDGDSDGSWEGEVTGPPLFYPLGTVDVLLGGRSIKVFDKNCRVKWEAPLSAVISDVFDRTCSTYGVGLHPSLRAGANGLDGFDLPCFESDELLLIADSQKVTAFKKDSGEVVWRVNSPGVHRIIEAVNGSLLLSTEQNMKALGRKGYGETIDILMGVKPDTGEVLWSADFIGYKIYPTGRRLYSLWVGQNEGSMMGVLYGDDQVEKQLGAVGNIDPVTGLTIWKNGYDRPPTTVDAVNNVVLVQFQQRLEVISYFSF